MTSYWFGQNTAVWGWMPHKRGKRPDSATRTFRKGMKIGDWRCASREGPFRTAYGQWFRVILQRGDETVEIGVAGASPDLIAGFEPSFLRMVETEACNERARQALQAQAFDDVAAWLI